MSLRDVIQQREALTIGQYTVLRMHTRKGRSAWVLSRNSYASGVIVQQLRPWWYEDIVQCLRKCVDRVLDVRLPILHVGECSSRFGGDAGSL